MFLRDQEIMFLRYYLDHYISGLNVLTVTFTTGIVVLFIFLMVSRISKLKRTKHRELLVIRIQVALQDFLFSEDEPMFNMEIVNTLIDIDVKGEQGKKLRAQRKELRRKIEDLFTNVNLKEKFQRKVLMEQVIRLHSNFSGAIQQKLRMLYLLLDLKKDSIRLLHSFRWHHKARGVYQLSEMRIKECYNDVAHYLNHSNPVLRNQVQAALVELSYSNTMSFLNDTHQKLTDWQQINLLGIISGFDKKQVPQFKKWVTSANDSVAIFSIRMVAHFNQYDGIDALLQALQHSNSLIRIEAIRALAKLEAMQALPRMLELYSEEDPTVKTEILTALRLLGTDDQREFLKHEFLEGNYNHKLESARALLATGDHGRESLDELRHVLEKDSAVAGIIDHALDNRI